MEIDYLRMDWDPVLRLIGLSRCAVDCISTISVDQSRALTASAGLRFSGLLEIRFLSPSKPSNIFPKSISLDPPKSSSASSNFGGVAVLPLVSVIPLGRFV